MTEQRVPGQQTFYEDEERRLRELLKAKIEAYRAGFNATPPTPKFRNLAELNAALDKQRAAAKARQIDPKKRIAEIERELDIIRGVVPTPQGYTIDTAKVKKLTQELKQIKPSDRT